MTRSPRALANAVLNWAALLYGCYATAIEPVWRHDDVRIAIGGEVVVLALVGFLFAGSRRQLGWALVTAGLCAAATVWSTAPLFYDEISGELLLVGSGVSAVIGLPLVLLGVHVLRRRGPERPHPRPWWLIGVRWLIVAGMWVVVFGFRGGDWDGGVAYVYAGGALALLGLLVALPNRLSVTRRGLGLFLLFLGVSALLVIGVGAAAVGSHMSGDEAAVGLLPAGVLALVGAVLAIPKSRPVASRGGGGDYDERIEEIAIDQLHR